MGQSSVKYKRIFSLVGDASVPDRIVYLENNEYKILYFQTINSATGTITPPPQATILLDQFYEGGDAIVETLNNSQPTGQSPLTIGGAVVSVTSFDTAGNYVLSGTPVSFPVALIYILKIKGKDYQNLNVDNIMSMTTTETAPEVEWLSFDTTPITVPDSEAVMSWNDSLGTVDLQLKGSTVVANLGQNLVARVVNKATIDLLRSNYQVVKITGATGQRLSADLAQADNDPNSVDTLGIVSEDILKNQEGFITTFGLLANINTTGSLQGETWNDGDPLYLSATVAGGITKVRPTAPNHGVSLGYVEYAHINNGKIFVKIQNGYELAELHDVYAPSPTNGDTIAWNSTTNRYENKSVLTLIGFTPENVANKENTVLDTSTTKYPTNNLVKTNIDAKVTANTAITGATKTKITYDAKGLVTSGADATTADIAASTDKNYVTDAQLVVIGNTSGINSGNQILTNTSDATSHTVTLSSTGGSVKLVEGSGVTLTTTGTSADGIITIASTGGGGGVTAVTGTSPIASSGGTTPDISISQATTSTDGYLSSTDWNTFNNKQNAITRVFAFTTAETAISTTTYADITGASISLAAGTWLIYATINGRAVNSAFVMFCAITDGANTVIAEAAQNSPGAGTASSNNWGSVTITAFVTPASTTTYKLRAARGTTGPTTTWTASDGIGTNTTNNGNNASDKSTGLFAIKLA